MISPGLTSSTHEGRILGCSLGEEKKINPLIIVITDELNFNTPVNPALRKLRLSRPRLAWATKQDTVSHGKISFNFKDSRYHEQHVARASTWVGGEGTMTIASESDCHCVQI